MRSDPAFHGFESPERLHAALARQVAEDLREAIALRGDAALMLSGGRTPVPFLECLSREALAWKRVRVGLVDERWVDPNDDASNEKLIRTHLLKNRAREAECVGMYRKGMTAEAACGHVGRQIREELMPFDVVVLGMGTDGHTASLFPGCPTLAKALDPANSAVCTVLRPESSPHPRMSLTLSALLGARHCYLHIEGEEKLAVYREAMAGTDALKMPIRALLRRKPAFVQVYYG